MAQSIDDLLDQPVIQNTLEQILGRPLNPDAQTALQNRVPSPEGVPASLQDNPTYEKNLASDDTEEANPVPESLRANEPDDDEEDKQVPAALQANPEAPAETDKEDEEEEESQPAASKTSAPAAPAVPTPDDQANKVILPPPQQILNFGSQQQNQPTLEQALQEQRDRLRWAQFQAGAEQLTAGLLRRPKVDYSGSEMMAKQAGLPLQEFALRQKNEANDPKSGISSGLRDYIKSLGVNVSEGTTASQINSVLPMVFKDIENKQAQKAKGEQQQQRLQERKEEAEYRNKLLGLRQQEIAANRDIARQDRLSKQSDTNNFKVGTALEQIRGDKALQNARETIRRVASANQILSRYPNLDKVPENISNIITQDLGTIVTGGVLGQQGFNEIANPTYYSKLMTEFQKLGNKPTGAQLGAFLQQNQGLLNELKGTAEGFINDKYRRVLNTQGKILNPSDRENYRSIYLPQDKPDQNGTYIGTQGGAGAPPVALTMPPNAQQGAIEEMKKRGIIPK